MCRLRHRVFDCRFPAPSRLRAAAAFGDPSPSLPPLPLKPEKQVGTDRGPEDRHETLPCVVPLRPRRDERVAQNGAPIWLDNKSRHDISKEKERQPFQSLSDLKIAEIDC